MVLEGEHLRGVGGVFLNAKEACLSLRLEHGSELVHTLSLW